MPYDWSVDQATHTILVHGYGPGVTAETLRLIAGLQPTLLECLGFDFLYDALELEIDSSPAEMMQVAGALFGEAGARFRRFAIVVPPERVGLGRIFAALAHPYGVTANVFGDVETAREWLATRSERGRGEPGMPQSPPPVA